MSRFFIVSHQNYPNPFNPRTSITFSLESESKVILKLFDILGQNVSTLVIENFTDGSHSIDFNASGLNSGVYFYRLNAEPATDVRFSVSKKMVLTK